MDLFELNGRVVVDLADALKAFDAIQKEGQVTESKLSKVFSGVGKGAMALGKTVAVGIGAGVTAFAGLTAKALSASGELEQNMGGSEAVFQEYAQTVQDTAKTAYSSMGLSTSEFLATANKMGSLFKGAGFEASEAADITTQAMQRAADVASIMGIDAASAMESIAGAAKGNFTMMDNLGVAMNDTTLNAYALEKGIGKTTQQMTNQEKIGLAMQMFMEKTADYAGNYTKENETLSGSLGTAKAALMNFLDGSGSVDDLANAFVGALNSMIGSLESILPRLAEGIPQLVSKVVPMIPQLLSSLLPSIVQGATDLVNGLVAVIPEILGLLLDVVLPQLIDSFTVIIESIMAALPDLIGMLASALPTLIPQLIDALVSMVVMLCELLPQIIQPIIDNLPEIVISIVSALTENLPILIDGLIALVVGIVDAIPQIVQALVDSLPKIIELIIVALFECREALIRGAIQLVGALVSALPQIMASLREALPKAFLGIWNGVKEVFSRVPEWFGERFDAAFKAIAKAFSGVKDALLKPFITARDKIQEVADKIKGFFKGEISMPKIKLPKFSITPKGWKIGDLLDGKIPKLGITWHAKGGIMKEPTLFGYNPATGTFHGGGEAGDEAVAPISTLQQYVSAAVAEQNGIMASKLDRIIDLLVRFFPEMVDALNIEMYLNKDVLVAETVGDYDVALGKLAIKKGRGR